MSRSRDIASGTYPLERRNSKPIIINGDMQVAQRATSKTGVTTSGYHTADRMQLLITNQGTWTVAQSTDAPDGTGLSKSYRLDCTTADASPSAADLLLVSYGFEGQDVQLLEKGTSNAKKVTIAFYVKSNKTGTYILELDDNDNARNINQAYTISSADTWEKKVLSFDADTTGVLGNDNELSLRFLWWLGAGSNYTSGTLETSWASTTNANRAVGQVNLADSTSNDWSITGVQVEVGEFDANSIPPFQHEALQDSFFRCQRYYQNQGNNFYGMTEGTTRFRMQVPFDRPMRAAPSSTSRGVGFKFNARYLGDHTTDNPTISDAASTKFGVWLGVNGTSLTANTPIYGRSQQADAGHFLALSAEI